MIDNNVIKQLEKAVETQYNSSGQLIIYIKPKNKNSMVIYDTEQSSFDIIENELVFDIWSDTYKDFSIKLDNIKSVNFEEYDDITISFICLKNGNTIMIHSFINQ